MTGYIHSFQSLGTVDGPGLRFVVFMQGCNLRCAYCHNVDTWKLKEGIQATPKEVFQKILRYKNYFRKQGGLTVSGGEALLQADFVKELFILCHESGIHTALDTSGSILNPSVEALLDYTDLCILDIKMTEEASYDKYIGCGLEKPLQFLQLLNAHAIDTWIRQVIVPGINDNLSNIKRLYKIVEPYDCVSNVELLPFKKLCLEKYQTLGIQFPFDDICETPKNTMDFLQNYYNKLR